MTSRTVFGSGLVLSAALLGGCQNTREGVERDAENAAAATERAAERSAQEAREAGQAAREGAGAAVTAGDAAQQTAQIKTALLADTAIDATSIDVDTDGATKTVTLQGRVRTAAEKSKAASIAAAKAPGYRISNNLEVGR